MDSGNVIAGRHVEGVGPEGVKHGGAAGESGEFCLEGQFGQFA